MTVNRDMADLARSATTVPTDETSSNETGITAGTTQTQAGATALTKEVNVVTVVGSTGDGVKLPSAVAGLRVRIINTASSGALKIWPATGDQIDNEAANAADPNLLNYFGSYAAVPWWKEYVAYNDTNWVTTGQNLAVKAGQVNYTVSTATGSQAITGVGFKPSVVHIYANQATVAGKLSFGFAEGMNGNNEFCLRDTADSLGYHAYYPVSAYLVALSSSSNRVHAVLNSMDDDGFTLGWTKTGTPTGTATLQWLAFR